MRNDEPSFNLFFGIDPKKASRPGVAAALQAFETSLYLIAMQRWPAVITQVYLSIELLLRAFYETDPKNEESSVNLIRRFAREGKASSSLIKAAHDLRKFRNQIVHQGYSPKDDGASRRHFLFSGVPVFQNLLRFVVDEDLYSFPLDNPVDAIFFPNAQNWYWDNYKKCRKAVTSCINAGEVVSSHQMLFFDLACRRVALQGGKFQSYYAPYFGHVDEWIRNNDSEAEYLANEEAVTNFIGRFSDHDEVYVLEKSECPVCGTYSLLFNAKWDSDDAEVLVGIDQIGCVSCDYLTDCRHLITSYFMTDDIVEMIVGKKFYAFKLANEFPHLIVF